jgi:hypothetical protein
MALFNILKVIQLCLAFSLSKEDEHTIDWNTVPAFVTFLLLILLDAFMGRLMGWFCRHGEFTRAIRKVCWDKSKSTDIDSGKGHGGALAAADYLADWITFLMVNELLLQEMDCSSIEDAPSTRQRDPTESAGFLR